MGDIDPTQTGLADAVRPRRSFRMAFLTPEFVTETTSEGGLASYLARMTEALLEAGHRPEIVTLTRSASGTTAFRGVPVHRVHAPSASHPMWKTARNASHHLGLAIELVSELAGAYALARRLADLERAEHFDAVQSADFGFTGLFVPHRRWRTHVVRCSWSGELYLRTDADTVPLKAPLVGLIERRCIRRADRAYAPSRYLADYFQSRHGLDLDVVRPPLKTLQSPDGPGPPDLPAKYLVHFGQLRRRKGTDVVTAALPLVWASVPDFRMVWAGPEEEPGLVARARALWGEHSHKVVHLGALDRPRLMVVLAGATAAVLPSAVDNLPNTVIESLSLGVPVIGSAGASIDELIQDDMNGYLVALRDVEGLAKAMIRMWHNEPHSLPMRRSPVIEQMAPPIAVERLLALIDRAAAGR
ncbi:MAG: glycosyltransferase family 4 protein [Vicinamibacterales bacterium]